MNTKLLLVCYDFPPNSGIGGRKWAFLAKYLLKKNIDLYVITKQNDHDDSNWDIDLQSVKRFYFKANYPSILNSYPVGIFKKIKYRITLFCLKILIKGNYYDRGKLLGKEIIKKTEDVCREFGIRNIVFTGGPFSFLYYGSMIKKNNSKLNFISDFRDPWTFGNYNGFQNLSNNKQDQEYKYLSEVLRKSDTIIVPNGIIKDYYTKIYQDSKINIMPHAVDVQFIKKRKSIKCDRINFVNFGSQYFGLDGWMNIINEEINKTKIDIVFYTNDFKYKLIFKNNKHINYHPPVKYSSVFDILSEANGSLLFVNNQIKDFLSTKYIECFAARIPIVLIGEKGFVSNFIENNRLGIFIEGKNLKSEFNNIPEKLKELDYNDKFDVTSFTFERQADEMIALLK